MTRDVPGYPVVDEDYHGVFIHRWVKPRPLGPLFGLSFVAGVVGALRRLRGAIDVIHTHQGLWEAVATGIARHRLRRHPDARAAGQCGLLWRGRRAGAHPGLGPASPAHPGQHGLRRDLGGDRAAVARAGRPGRPHGADGQRRRRRPVPPGTLVDRGRAAAAPACGLHRPVASPEEHPPPAGSLDGGRPPLAGQPDPGRAGQRPADSSRRWPARSASAVASSSPAGSTIPPSTSARPTFSSCPAWPRV